MAYQELSEATILAYLQTRPALEPLLTPLGELSAKEVGDGNLNAVYIIESVAQPSKGIVVKQALPYLRILGEDWKLTRERIRFETESLRLYNDYAPGLAPTIYDYDDEMSLVAMEYLSNHLIMRKALVARQELPHFANHISTFLANTLFFTSDLYLTGLEKKTLQARFINPHLCKIQEDFVFTNPLMDSPENEWNPLLDEEAQWVRTHNEVKIAAAQMKADYMGRAQALIHSDLHTGSIMLNAEDTRVIDSEFAFYGPMGFDIGALLENLVLNLLSHYGHTEDGATRVAYQEYLLTMIRDIWMQFATKFENLWVENNKGELAPPQYWQWDGGDAAFAKFRRRFLLEVLRDTAAYGGIKMLRRMLGVVTVWDISSIEDPATRAIAERKAIRIGVRWLLEREQMNSIEDLIMIVREEMARS